MNMGVDVMHGDGRGVEWDGRGVTDHACTPP